VWSNPGSSGCSGGIRQFLIIFLQHYFHAQTYARLTKRLSWLSQEGREGKADQTFKGPASVSFSFGFSVIQAKKLHPANSKGDRKEYITFCSKVGIPETVKISWFAQLEWGYVWGIFFVDSEEKMMKTCRCLKIFGFLNYFVELFKVQSSPNPLIVT
jgi:hypothetical protein